MIAREGDRAEVGCTGTSISASPFATVAFTVTLSRVGSGHPFTPLSLFLLSPTGPSPSVDNKAWAFVPPMPKEDTPPISGCPGSAP